MVKRTMHMDGNEWCLASDVDVLEAKLAALKAVAQAARELIAEECNLCGKDRCDNCTKAELYDKLVDLDKRGAEEGVRCLDT